MYVIKRSRSLLEVAIVFSSIKVCLFYPAININRIQTWAEETNLVKIQIQFHKNFDPNVTMLFSLSKNAFGSYQWPTQVHSGSLDWHSLHANWIGTINKTKVNTKFSAAKPDPSFWVEPDFGPKIRVESGRVGRVHLAALNYKYIR